MQSAWSAIRAKATYLQALFLRLKARRGPRKAIMAVAAAILTAVYWMLRRGVAYTDLGADHFNRIEPNLALPHASPENSTNSASTSPSLNGLHRDGRFHT